MRMGPIIAAHWSCDDGYNPRHVPAIRTNVEFLHDRVILWEMRLYKDKPGRGWVGVWTMHYLYRANFTWGD